MPPLPRTEQEQTALSLAAFEGPLLGSDNMSWGYYAEADSPREPFADVLSTLYRLNGTLPRVSSIVPEGSVLTNDAIYFLTNRTQEWKDIRGADVQRNLEEMNPDGTYSQRSLFPELEPDQRTSLGLCARKAAFLLDYARITGDRRSLDAAEKTLRWMQTRDVPRGGYYWETPFHTPDILSASYALWAMVRGFELTNKPEYLEEAKRFALLGLPFVYQWGDRPIMTYTVVPMFGASERERAWFWTAQPWAGLIYAYALNLLAPHDTSVDWKKIATGILVAAEQMQYPDGYYIGCLPDAFSLESQTRQLPTLNPCGLVSLRRAIEGKVDSLDVISNGPETLVSPFPLQPNKKGALVREVPAGFTFEVLFNGQRSQSIQGSGSQRDQIAF